VIKVCVTPEDGFEVCTTIDTGTDAAHRAYTTTVGDGTATSFTLNHGLDALELIPIVREVATGTIGGVTPTLSTINPDTATLVFPTAPAASQYRVTLLAVTPA
jgi:hypothetical protein